MLSKLPFFLGIFANYGHNCTAYPVSPKMSKSQHIQWLFPGISRLSQGQMTQDGHDWKRGSKTWIWLGWVPRFCWALLPPASSCLGRRPRRPRSTRRLFQGVRRWKRVKPAVQVCSVQASAWIVCWFRRAWRSLHGGAHGQGSRLCSRRWGQGQETIFLNKHWIYHTWRLRILTLITFCAVLSGRHILIIAVCRVIWPRLSDASSCWVLYV